jgi:hypothetical protein
MTYFSRTVTEPVTKKFDDARFESNKTHHIIVVNWEHCYKESITISVTNSPLKVAASSYDGINYHSLEFSLTLNYDILTLADSFYDFHDEGFRIHIPKEDMKLRKPETVSLPFRA